MTFGRCFSCIKYAVFVFNFLFWLLGCSMLAVGIWLRVDDNAGRYVVQTTAATSNGDDVKAQAIVSYSQVADSSLVNTLAYLFIAFGCLIILVTFIGCCGAVRESRCMLMVFMSCLLILFIVLLAIGIWAFVEQKTVNAHTIQLQLLTNKMVRDAVRNYYVDSESMKFMDTVQKQFRCCGADNAAGDYVQGSTQRPPQSCDLVYQRHSCLQAYFHYVGNTLEEIIKDRFSAVAAVAIGIACCLILGMLASLLLVFALRDRTWNTNA